MTVELPDISDSRTWLGRAYVAGALLTAAILGLSIVQGRWMVVALIAVVALVFASPVVFPFGTFALLLPFDSISTFGTGEVGSSVTYFAGAAAIATLLLVGLMRRFHSPSPATGFWAAYICLGAISAAWALQPDLVMQRLPTAFSLLLLLFVGASVHITKSELISVSMLAVAGGVVAALYAVLEFRGGMGGRTTLAMGASETDPNQFANSLLVPISLAFGGFLSFRPLIAKMMMLAALSVMIFGIYMAMSRGALIAFLAMILVYLYRLRANRRVLIPVVIAIAMLSAVPDLLFTRVEKSVSSHAEGRFDIWLAGVAATKHYGLLGAGLDNFPVAYSQFAGDATKFMGYVRAPHNIYLGTLVELGLGGLLLLLAAMGSLLRAAAKANAGLRRFSWAVSLEAASWAMVVNGFSLDIIWRKGFWLNWILLVIALRLCTEERKAPSKNDPYAISNGLLSPGFRPADRLETQV